MEIIGKKQLNLQNFNVWEKFDHVDKFDKLVKGL